MTDSRPRRVAGRVIRLAVAAGLTAYILWKSDPAEVLAITLHARWTPIVVAMLLVLVDRTLMAYRWVVLLCIVPEERRPPLGEVMRIFFVSTFVGTFLPASIGGDAVRAYSISRLDVAGGDAVASVLMDRMLGVASILIVALGGLLLAADLATNVTIITALAVAGAVCGITLLMVFTERMSAIAIRLAGWLPAALRDAAASVFDSIRRYSSHHGRLVNVLVSSVAVQVLRIVQAYYLGRGLGIAAPLSAYFAFIPLILLVMLLPVTFNGIGTSQAAFVWFFARIGVDRAASFALSVLFVALGIIGNLPGALLYVRGGQTRRS